MQGLFCGCRGGGWRKADTRFETVPQFARPGRQLERRHQRLKPRQVTWQPAIDLPRQGLTVGVHAEITIPQHREPRFFVVDEVRSKGINRKINVGTWPKVAPSTRTEQPQGTNERQSPELGRKPIAAQPGAAMRCDRPETWRRPSWIQARLQRRQSVGKPTGLAAMQGWAHPSRNRSSPTRADPCGLGDQRLQVTTFVVAAR
jgi:hypothetical protein